MVKRKNAQQKLRQEGKGVVGEEEQTSSGVSLITGAKSTTTSTTTSTVSTAELTFTITPSILEALRQGSRSGSRAQREPYVTYNPKSCEIGGPIAYSALLALHADRRKQQAEDARPVFLHELMAGSSVWVAPVIVKPKNPELVARLAKLKAEQENKEYLRMVSSITQPKDVMQVQASLELSNVGSQMSVGVNALAGLGTAFAIGYFLASGYGRTTALTSGLVCAVVGLVIEVLLFVISGSQLESYLDKKQKQGNRTSKGKRSKILPDLGGYNDYYTER